MKLLLGVGVTSPLPNKEEAPPKRGFDAAQVTRWGAGGMRGVRWVKRAALDFVPANAGLLVAQSRRQGFVTMLCFRQRR